MTPEPRRHLRLSSGIGPFRTRYCRVQVVMTSPRAQSAITLRLRSRFHFYPDKTNRLSLPQMLHEPFFGLVGAGETVLGNWSLVNALHTQPRDRHPSSIGAQGSYRLWQPGVNPTIEMVGLARPRADTDPQSHDRFFGVTTPLANKAKIECCKFTLSWFIVTVRSQSYEIRDASLNPGGWFLFDLEVADLSDRDAASQTKIEAGIKSGQNNVVEGRLFTGSVTSFL